MSDPGNQAYSWAAAMDHCDQLLARAERAEAERDALREFVQDLLAWDIHDPDSMTGEAVVERAREALAAGGSDE